MRSTFDELTTALGELKALVASIAPVNTALAGHGDSLVREYLTVRRRFDYAAFVVSLYASFEDFIEKLAASYAGIVAARTAYAALPSGLARKHLKKTAEILARGRLGEGRYDGIAPLELVKNLFDCLSAAEQYKLNDIAVVAHDQNLRFDEIAKLFSSVGIERICERARRADAVVAWYCESEGLDEPPQDGVPLGKLRNKIDDLVDRRNEVAHRGGRPDNLLGPREMTEMIEFIESFARSLFTMSVAAYLEGRCVDSDAVAALRVQEGPYARGMVLVVERPRQRLYAGQPVFGLIEGAGVRWGRITELRVDDVPVPAIDSHTDASTVGVRVDFRCSKNIALYALDSDDDAIWSPAPAPDTSAPP